MATTFPPEMIDAVRAVAHQVSGQPLYEITLESHLYWDIEMDSTSVVEFIAALEACFGLGFGEIDDVEFSCSAEGVREWAAYVRAVEEYAGRSLGALKLSPYVEERIVEIEALSREYGVLPFSIGFVCAFVSRRLDDLAGSRGG